MKQRRQERKMDEGKCTTHNERFHASGGVCHSRQVKGFIDYISMG